MVCFTLSPSIRWHLRVVMKAHESWNNRIDIGTPLSKICPRVGPCALKIVIKKIKWIQLKIIKIHRDECHTFVQWRRAVSFSHYLKKANNRKTFVLLHSSSCHDYTIAMFNRDLWDGRLAKRREKLKIKENICHLKELTQRVILL